MLAADLQTADWAIGHNRNTGTQSLSSSQQWCCTPVSLCLNERKHGDAATAIRPKINITFFTAPTASGWLFLLVDLEGLTGSCVVCYLWSWNAEYAKVWLDDWLVFLSVNRVLYTSVVYAAFNCLQHTCPCEHAITQIPLNPAVAYYGNENKE